MEQKLTCLDVVHLQDTEKVSDDLLLLPEQAEMQEEDARALFGPGVIPLSESIINAASWRMGELQHKYDAERVATGAEPAWVNDLPASARPRLRFNWALQEEDALFIIPAFFSSKNDFWRMRDGFAPQPTFAAGFSYMVLQGGLCHKTFQAFRLWRLEQIKQLGFLQAPTYNNYTKDRQSLSESHRWLHSLDVYVIAMAMARNLGLYHKVTLGIAALSHDAGTPAGGDSVKLVAPAELDEDANYPMILGRADLRDLRHHYRFDEQLLIDAVQGKGSLGTLLDIADKLAYVARDISKCLHHIEIGSRERGDNGEEQHGLQTLLQILREHPYICGIWDCVEMNETEEVYFTDIHRLVAFLKVRILLFRELYYHPTARFGEFLMSRLFVKVLYDKGELTRDMLLEMTDHDLLRLLDERFGSGAALETCSSSLARVKTFSTPEEGDAFIQNLKEQGNVFAMLDDNRRAIKTGSHFLVKTRDGVRPLQEAAPEIAKELEEMATLLPLVHVYYLDGEPALPRDKLAEMAEHLQTHPAR